MTHPSNSHAFLHRRLGIALLVLLVCNQLFDFLYRRRRNGVSSINIEILKSNMQQDPLSARNNLWHEGSSSAAASSASSRMNNYDDDDDDDDDDDNSLVALKMSSFDENNHDGGTGKNASSFPKKKKKKLLPLGHYISTDNSSKRETLRTTNAQELLDFSILGFAKTGTSFLANSWLSSDDRICMPRGELRTWPRPVATATAMYNSTRAAIKQDGKSCLLTGYKSPSQILHPEKALTMLSTFWPSSKLIIGVRHPVLWFESFFNFRSRLKAMKSPPENLRAGNCEGDVCTDNSAFHVFLSYLGKTTLASPEEQSILRPLEASNRYSWKSSRVVVVPNEVFLYDASQLDAVRNPLAFEAMRVDLSVFLGLDKHKPLPPRDEATNVVHFYNKSLNICEAQYASFRNELVEIGSRASKWILEYFVTSPGVTVSGPYLEQALARWHFDPCNHHAQNN